MRKIAYLVLLLFITSGSNIFSQLNWASQGAIWHYNYKTGGIGSGPATGYLTVEVISDSIVGDTILSKLEIVRYLKNGSVIHEGYEFTFSKDSVVYYWKNDTAFVMYDFTTKVGEAMQVYGYGGNECGSNMVGSVILDSISTEELNGIISHNYYTSPTEESIWELKQKTNTIYGNMWFLFAQQKYCGVMDYENFTDDIRCYEDEIVGLISFAEYPCNALYIDGIGEINTFDNAVHIWPNPAGSFIYIEIEEIKLPKDLSIMVYSTLGEVLYSSTFCSGINEIPLVQFPPGLYSINIIGLKQNIMFNNTFLKN